MTIDDVANAGSMLGSGAVGVMDEDTNLVYAAKSIVSFFAHESCGQCTPSVSYTHLTLPTIYSV